MDDPIQAPDKNYLIRCPRLGHQIYFAYCRQENQGAPCFKVLDCWHNHFDVEQFLKSRLKEDQWRNLCTQRTPKPKMLSLMELIDKARASQKTQSDQADPSNNETG